MTKIIYTLKLMVQLVEMGHQPVTAMPNPRHPNLTCWVFKNTEEFQRDLSLILGDKDYGKCE